MDNFTGTEWEGMTEEDIFLSNRKLVKTTISRKFPSNQAFCKLISQNTDSANTELEANRKLQEKIKQFIKGDSD